MSNTVLVTGGAGYVGSHVCKALAQSGFQPVVFDNLFRGHAHAVKWGPLVVGDILDREALRAAFEAHQPAAVLHFAALTYVGESVSQPTWYYRNNVVGSLNIIEAMQEAGCQAIVFSSTCAVYGMVDRPTLHENLPLAPINAYGHSKRMVEQLLADVEQPFGIRSAALRYFNAAGADPEGEIGEEHDPETHLIPLVLRTATGLQKEIQVFGTDYPTPDGTAIRDYIHVCDLASAHVAALRYLLDGGPSVALNLGTGHGHSVRAVIEAVQRVTGLPIPVTEVGRRAGDATSLVAEAGRAGGLLGWQPKLDDLDEMVKTAWDFHLAWMERNGISRQPAA